MKFSELWLREWVNPAISSDLLADQITMAGLEVDAIDTVAGDFHGVVIGHVVECGQHPNADKLRVTKVDIGTGHLLDIVCGAPNCRQGLKVAVAIVGAVLPAGLKIKATKLRGAPSEGMLCSAFELGFGEDQVGIIELPASASIGTDIREFLQLNDNIIEINVTPNRADCLSIIGVARDLAVVNRLPLIEPEIIPLNVTLQDTLPIHVLETSACPRYLGRIVKGINLSIATPQWMSEKLRRCGIRPIDPVVDITNYVLMELGQPMHAFDLDRIDSEIVVRFAAEGEKLTLLDGSKAHLDADTLVIADRQKVLAMAGVLGGEHSGINKQTRNLLLECAFFNPLAIAGRARRYGLHTDASHRYERGVDPALQYKAMERATRLLIDICGGEASSIIDVTTEKALPKVATINLRYEKLCRLLGHSIPEQQVSDILRRLGCQVTEKGNSWQIVAPSWRFDMQIEEDLIEEIARIYGYNCIPNIPIKADLLMTPHPEADLSLKRVKTLLVDRGYQEAITYSFVDPEMQALLHPQQESLILPNPISADMSAMRLSLLTGLLSAVIYNQHRQQTRLRMFESGLCFTPDKSAEFEVRQDLMLAGVITGNCLEKHWDLPSRQVDFYDLKGDLEAILELTGKLSMVQFRGETHPALHPGQSAGIYLSDESIGFIGVVHPRLEEKLGLHGRTVVFELQCNKLANLTLPGVCEISRFPANRRDIAIVVAEDIPAADILAECEKISVNQIVGVNLFDVYCGKGISEGRKGLAISLTLQDTTRTLEEEEIAATVEKCVTALKQRFQASLRD
ncbi:phenylalanine--tRNA ligase subunit beta [Candidatus Fukatsuia endosymbiont of Tuberolachnus salignus]|uniref:phenylalanine--tRNA ligase subunit beta n=1 Tax=Candidatus Fukatsuia endosymbiont of Tuberolachnus salignus TaxID=3077957 RepID=UPI00313CC669